MSEYKDYEVEVRITASDILSTHNVNAASPEAAQHKAEIIALREADLDRTKHDYDIECEATEVDYRNPTCDETHKK
jgi:hypothetical protein